jgi:predicted XRE-type DNA-binding protein
MERTVYENIFEAITDDKEEVKDLTLRAQAMRSLILSIRKWGIPQKEAALKLGLSQPRLSDLMNGHIDKFSLDMLINLAKQAGLSVKIEFSEAA